MTNTTTQDISNNILSRLYEAFFLQEGNGLNLHEPLEQHQWNSVSFWKTIDEIEKEGLIRSWTMGGSYKIGTQGILYVEDNGLVDYELVNNNRQARETIFEKLLLLHETSLPTFLSAEVFANEMGLDVYTFINNIRVLMDLGCVEDAPYGSFSLTEHGLVVSKRWRELKALSDEFGQISELLPQPRGRALQRYFAKVIAMLGWLQEESVKTTYEEIDVVVYKERESYLVECKWEKDPIEAEVVEKLFGKLSHRDGVRGGIVLSMSGFSKGAIDCARDHSGKATILLWGQRDLNAMVGQEKTFEELLTAKYQDITVRRKVTYQ